MLAKFPGMAYQSLGNLNGGMQYISNGAVELSGYQLSELLGAGPMWTDLTHANDQQWVKQARQQAIDAGEEFELQYRIVTKSGEEKWVWERGSGTQSDDRPPVVEGFVSDITSLIEGRDQLQLDREKMVRVDKLNVLAEMMAGIAHEINQPLTAVSTYAQSSLRFLDPENPRPERLREALTKMINEIQRAGSVVQRIRDFAGARTGDNERIDCNALIIDARDLAFALAREHDVTLDLQPAKAPVYVWGERIGLLQVLFNLLRNAMEAMGLQPTDACIRLQVMPVDDEVVRIAVVDSGAGIDDVEADTIFRPFSTQKQERLGLGLTTSRAIALAHGGQLGYFNNDTNGATFYLELPQAPRSKAL